MPLARRGTFFNCRPWGWPGQRERRRLETEVRQDVLELCHDARALGRRAAEVARALGLPERTLRHWGALARHDPLQARPRGRPVLRSPRHERQAVLDFVGEIGPAVGLSTLQACFPTLPRAELHDLLGRYRRVWQTRYHGTMHVLEWARPGSVWAMDFAEAPVAIDGTWPYLLAVRDLASGQQLLWLPVGDETAATALRELELLWTRWGAPLVLKADNGSAFVAGALKRLACVWGVQLLYSPPWRPSYNGSVEAGIGALKTRTPCQAGHAGLWTGADVEAAREQANELARPWGVHGASPEQVWQVRSARRSGRTSGRVWRHWSSKNGVAAGWRRSRNWDTWRGRRSCAKRSVVRLWRTAYSCLRGGEFLYRFVTKMPKNYVKATDFSPS